MVIRSLQPLLRDDGDHEGGVRFELRACSTMEVGLLLLVGPCSPPPQ
jgi:hypothetical protein